MIFADNLIMAKKEHYHDFLPICLGRVRHKASPNSRLLNMNAYYKALKRNPSGRLTKESARQWRDWLDSIGIGTARAYQIMGAQHKMKECP